MRSYEGVLGIEKDVDGTGEEGSENEEEEKIYKKQDKLDEICAATSHDEISSLSNEITVYIFTQVSLDVTFSKSNLEISQMLMLLLHNTGNNLFD